MLIRGLAGSGGETAQAVLRLFRRVVGQFRLTPYQLAEKAFKGNCQPRRFGQQLVAAFAEHLLERGIVSRVHRQCAGLYPLSAGLPDRLGDISDPISALVTVVINRFAVADHKDQAMPGRL